MHQTTESTDSKPEWSYLEFSEQPLSDSCWSVQTGPDGRVYIAACTEHTGGETATVLRYNEKNQSLESLFELDKVTGDLRDSGRATQCKIHYSFVPDPEKGFLHAATHLSGPPAGEEHYNPWASWSDPTRAFRGSYLISYDTGSDSVVESRLMIPKEGCRCLAFDGERRILYAITYPRDHFVSFRLADGCLTDYGRIGSVNSQCIFLDHKQRAYFFDDRGILLRFDPEDRMLRELPHVYPHADYQTPWHGVIYDAVEAGGSGAVYMVPWKSPPFLARFWPMEGAEGRMESLGMLTQERDATEICSVNLDHVGGLIWGADDRLYFVKSEWTGPCQGGRTSLKTISKLVSFDPSTNRFSEHGCLHSAVGQNHYVSRGAMTSGGEFLFGKILTSPAGVYRVRLPGHPPQTTPKQYLRMWG